MKIILKSSSPRRKELLAKAGYDFEVHTYDVDETMDTNLTPYENVLKLGYKKAIVKSELFEDDIQIGCDTIVVYNNKIYGKPKDEQDEIDMLTTFSGNTHSVLSGVGIIYKDKTYNFVVESKVTFKNLSSSDINEYLETKEWIGKAGGYAIQGIGFKLISHYEGSLNNIIGFPIEEIKDILGEIYDMEN